MKKALLLLPLFIASFDTQASDPLKPSANTSEAANLYRAQQYMNTQATAFEENKGQVTGADANRVKYTYKAQGLSVFLLNNGIAYQFHKTHYPAGYKHPDKFALPEEREQMEKLAKDIRTETYRMDVVLLGANPNANITTEGKSQDYIQYYNHNALDVHSYNKITYHEVYPNIDWVVYKSDNNLKYDFVVRPGGNPKQIQLKTNWVEDLKLNSNGSLSLGNRMGSIMEQTPVSYQEGKTLATTFSLRDGIISFDIADYNPTQTLTIDPLVRLWGTYYGGSHWDGGTSCAVDAFGNVFVSGGTNSTSEIAFGGHQNVYGGVGDAFLVKFNSAGDFKWGTYYGGGGFENGWSCCADDFGNVYLAGSTFSSTNISFGGHQNTIGASTYDDAFLVKFNSAGVRIWGTYYGGEKDDIGWSCAVDPSGNVYLSGWTGSTTAIAFGGHQNVFGGVGDAFLVKFNSAGIRLWGTYFGGSDNENGRSCAVDASGNIYLAGITRSTNAIASNGHQNLYADSADAYLVKFNSSGIRLWGTYYGGSSWDAAYNCAVDGIGNVYLAGGTGSKTAIAYGGHQNVFGGISDAFLVKFNSSGVRQWGTYYGGSEPEWGTSAVDPSGSVYLAGYTYSTNAIASGGYQNLYADSGDAYLVKFNSSGIRLWGTYFGGSSGDGGEDCAVDGSGNVYLAGGTRSNTAIASGGHQNVYGEEGDAFLVKFDGNYGTSIEDKTTASESIKIYPNPNTGHFTLSFPNSAARSIAVYDSYGRLVMEQQSNRQQEHIQLPQVASAIYYVNITEGDEHAVKLLMVQ